METFVWSDLHVDHVHLAENWRPWAGGNVPAHNETLRQAWESVVGPNDRVVIVGDAVMGQRAASLAVLATFPGRKELVPGNHDDVHAMTKPAKRERALAMYGKVFDRIWPETVRGEDLLGIPSTVVTHFPWHGTPDHEGSERGHYERWIPHRKNYEFGTVLIHGHTHSSARVSEHAIHVGVDAWPDGPVPLDTIRDLLPHARAWI